MSDVLLDTDAVSILFKPAHRLHEKSFSMSSGHYLLISFMTRAELMLWPRRNSWGPARYQLLQNHIALFTTLFPDDDTCLAWADVVAKSYSAGRPMSTGDAWIAACARQWSLPLITANFRHFEHLRGITLAPLE